VPRDFDSDDPDAVLSFTENVECPACELIFHGEFTDQSRSLSVQDMTEAPVGRHHCPDCGMVWDSEMTGWMLFSEAG
jgi:rubredoxin